MIVSDFDGTLVDKEECVPISTVLLIDKLRREGFIFVISTGRCLKSISYYNNDFPFIDYIAACNGAYIYDTINDKCIYKKNLLISNVKKIIKNYIDKSIIYAIDNNVWHLLTKEAAYKDDFDVIKEDDYLKFLDNNKNNIYKIELYFKTIKAAKEAIKEINSMNLKANANLQINHDKYIVEITHQDINKLESIKLIANKNNISLEEVISFGDGHNDIELLKKSGLGIATENAVKEVKKIADDITLDYNNKGVETYLKKINLGKIKNKKY